MNENSYYTAISPPEFRILGLNLKPLSLGRYHILKRFDNAYVADETRTATLTDLIIGVLVCSMTVKSFNAMLAEGSMEKEVRRWARRLTPFAWAQKIPGLRRAWHAHYGINIFEKMKMFQDYVKANSVLPRFWSESDGGGGGGAEWSHGVEVLLRSECNWDQNALDELPLNQALMDWVVWMEQHGHVRIMTQDEIARVDEPLPEKEEKAMREWAEKLWAAGIGTHHKDAKP